MPIAVISPSISSLYRLIDLYCSIASKEILKEMPFICLKEFNAAGAYFSIKNQNVFQLVRMTSFPSFRRIYDEATLKIFEELKALRNRSRFLLVFHRNRNFVRIQFEFRFPEQKNTGTSGETVVFIINFLWMDFCR